MRHFGGNNRNWDYEKGIQAIRILKYSYRKEIPAGLLYRKKTGFGVPVNYLSDHRDRQLITVGILKNEWKDI